MTEQFDFSNSVTIAVNFGFNPNNQPDFTANLTGESTLLLGDRVDALVDDPLLGNVGAIDDNADVTKVEFVSSSSTGSTPFVPSITSTSGDNVPDLSPTPNDAELPFESLYSAGATVSDEENGTSDGFLKLFLEIEGTPEGTVRNKEPLTLESSSPLTSSSSEQPINYTSTETIALYNTGEDGIFWTGDEVEVARLVPDTSGNSAMLELTPLASDQTSEKTLIGSVNSEVLTGNDADNTIYGNGGDDYLDGKEGKDTIVSDNGKDALVGGGENDLLFANGGNDYLAGDDGDDRLLGGDNDDILLGGKGNDALNAGNDNDILNGNDGNDTLSGDEGDDGIIGNDGDDQITGSEGDDGAIGGNGNDGIFGNVGNDNLIGDAGNDVINGGDDIDDLFGGDDDDIIFGEADGDALFGENGNDVLVGGMGQDTLTGGSGSDIFGFQDSAGNIDLIKDFSVAEDLISITADDFGGNLTPDSVLESDMFVLGTAAVDNNDRFIFDNASGSLFFDLDGVGGIEQVEIAQLAAETALNANNIFVDSNGAV